MPFWKMCHSHIEVIGLSFEVRGWDSAVCLWWKIGADPLMILPGPKRYEILKTVINHTWDLKQEEGYVAGKLSSTVIHVTTNWVTELCHMWFSLGDKTSIASNYVCFLWDTEHWKMVKLTTTIHFLCKLNAVQTTLLVIIALYVTYV